MKLRYWLLILLFATPPLLAQEARSPSVSLQPGLNLLAGGSVQEDLKLDKEQLEALKQAIAKHAEAHRDVLRGIQDLKTPERNKKLRDLQAGAEMAVSKILRPEQMKRALQLQLQSLGVLALSESEVASQLQLTDEQRSTVSTLRQELLTQQRSVRGIDPREGQKKRDEIAGAQLAKAFDLLTPTQQAKWKELTGKPLARHSPEE